VSVDTEQPGPTPPAGTVPAAGTVAAPPAPSGTEPRVPGLSPSRANDFLQCPLLFRFRVVDRLPEPASAAAARGTLVHAVLEHLFDLPAPERTLEAATAALPTRWDELLEQDPRYVELHAGDGERAEFLGQAAGLLATWFTLEDPTRLEPRARELQVRHDLEGGPRLRGVVDRVDVAPNGWVRVVDYKTGRSPRAGFESSALFQMRFYAYVVWRTRGVLPKRLQLAYLGDGVVISHEPTEPEMHTLEARVRSIWSGIEDTARSGDWRPRTSRLCDWCAFRDRCPSFGGTPPPVPAGAVERAIGVTPVG